MSKLTLGSLFSGSGGFELGGLLCGIEPLWASEVEPFPIRVTTKRIPEMRHLSDITKINGASVPPVDIVTAGFCCQDLSVAGKRAGLAGERSGLFYQIPRIIKEMLAATNNEYPKYAVLENVPGMYSSNGGQDFQEVLNELIKIKDESLSVPMPDPPAGRAGRGKWSTSGEIVGDGFSVGWRTLDAQFWGVAQRRRRCYIVADFTGERAGEILFDESRLSGNPPQGFGAWQGTAGDTAAGSGNAVAVLNDQGGAFMDLTEDVTGTLRSQEHGHQPIVFEPGACSRLGGHAWQNEPTGALRADMGDNQLAVAVENHPADSRVKLSGDGVVQTLSERMGTGGGNVPLVMNERQYAPTVGENLANTLTGTDYKGTQCVFEPKIMPKAYGICSDASNSMRSGNPNSGVYEAETTRTLDGNGGNPSCNQGGMAVVSVQGSMIGRADKNGPQGSGVGEGVSFTLTETDKHAVCYQDKVGALCASDYKFPQNQQIDEGKAVVEQTAVENYQHSNYREVEVGGTLKAKGGDFPGGENMVVENRYVVRRLTPTECALLQGFPPNWCSGLETPEPTEEDICFWSEVFETHRKIIGTSTKPKSRNQLIKWLKNPHSDSAEYKMWGNGVCLPVVIMVLSGIVVASNGGFEEKMIT